MIKFDDLHYSFREIDGYNKPFNFVISARELGKTTTAWLQKVYMNWKKTKKPWIYFVRTCVEITEALITSIEDTIINKFTDDNVTFEFNKGSFKDGIVDIKINKEMFVRIVSLSIPMRRIKLAVLKNIGGVLMDEYIIDPKTDEKYIKNESFKIKEAYTTWRREAEGLLKVYILANPYSLYNPLFLDWGVETNKLKKNAFYVGDTFIIHWATLNPLLREKLLELNPLYEFDEDYKDYALEGTAVNDKNIKLGTLPNNYSMRFVFRHEGRYVALFQNNNFKDNGDDRFFAKFVDSVSAKRCIYCFDFSELIERCMILGKDEQIKLSQFRVAMRRRLIVFEDISCYYFCEEIYKNL